MEELLRRIESLKKTEIYTGTVYENILSDHNISILKNMDLSVIKRECKIYPYYITWV